MHISTDSIICVDCFVQIGDRRTDMQIANFNCHGCGDPVCDHCSIIFRFCQSKFCEECSYENGIDSEKPEKCPVCDTGGLEGLLLDAVKSGNLETVKSVLSLGADVNRRERSCFNQIGLMSLVHKGRTPLFYAVKNNDIPLVEALIEGGAEVTIVSLENGDEDIDLFELARKNEHVDVLNLLLESFHTKVPSSDDLIFASRNGINEKVRQILETSHVDVNRKDWFGDTALLQATYGGHVDVVETLLDHSADMYVQNRHRANSYDVATINRFSQVAILFIQNGFDLCIRPGRYGPDVNPLFEAVKNENTEMFLFFLGKGFNVNDDACDGYGMKPLAQAVSTGSLEMVQGLVKAGADFGATGVQGESLFDIALQSLNPTERQGMPVHLEFAEPGFYRLAEITWSIIDYLLHSIDEPDDPWKDPARFLLQYALSHRR